MEKPSVQSMGSALTTTGAKEIFQPWGTKRTFQVVGRTTAGGGSCSVDIEVSDNGINFLKLATIALPSMTTTDSTDGFASDAGWKYCRANVTAIAGTGANVDITMGVTKNS